MGHREPPYTTRERVRAASGYTERSNALVDRAIHAASRAIDGQCHRTFYAETATRVFNWPPDVTSRSWRLWLDHNSLISVTSITIAGSGQTVGNFNLEPANDGPPYHSIEVDLSTEAAWTSSTTHQRAISINGFWGYDNVTDSAGTIAEEVDTSETEIDVTNGGLVGVGDHITIDSERMLVEEVEFLDTAVNTDGAITAQKSDTTIPTADESGNVVGETIRINDEEMLIRSITTGNLNVDRAVNGTVLAAHSSGDDIYANRRITVERAVTGTAAGSHSTSTAITKYIYQPLIEQWCIAEATVQLAQQSAAYLLSAGSVDNRRETEEIGLARIREMALAKYGRRVRTVAV